MLTFIVQLIGKVKWEGLKRILTGRRYNLTLEDWSRIKEILKEGNMVVLTYRKAHLSTYSTRLAELFINGKWGCWSHVLVSLDNEGKALPFYHTNFIEAIGKGVVVSNWFDVFNCDGVCILKPKWYSFEDLEGGEVEVIDELGKKYDTKLDPESEESRACVEIGRELLAHLPDYKNKMRVFEYMIQTKKYLTPDMFRDCPDFEVVLEIKR